LGKSYIPLGFLWSSADWWISLGKGALTVGVIIVGLKLPFWGPGLNYYSLIILTFE
jgi:hypothetical protein